MFLLGLGDIISAGLLLSRVYQAEIAAPILVVFGAYLLLKGLVFLKDVGSIMDVAAGIILILSLFLAIPSPVFMIFALLIGLKGIMSFFGRF